MTAFSCDDLRDAAVAYARAGWLVHPCEPRGKRPLLEHGFRDAINDVGCVDAWWKRWPAANIGIAVPVGLFVLDVDPRAGGDTTLGVLEAEHEPLPATLTARTGGGGTHHWFRVSGGELRGKLARGIDVKLPGRGYVIAPPSLHRCGRRYEWIDVMALAMPLPAWLEGRLRPRAIAASRERTIGANHDRYIAAALEREADAVARSAVGGRNHQLNDAAFSLGQLVASGLVDEATVREVLVLAARTCGLREIEAQRTIASGLLGGLRHPRGAR